MMSATPLIFIAVALLLGACSTFSQSPRKPVPLPDAAIGAAAPSVPAGAGRAGAETEPLFSTPGSARPGSEQRKEGNSSERRQADSEACYRFAWAQVDNDIRIDDDIASARGEAFSQFSRNTDLTKRVDSFYYEKQRSTRFESCMRSKGYDPD